MTQSDDKEADRTLAKLRLAAQQLGEDFDSVVIIATK